MKTTKIAIAGLGTVGQGVLEILNRRQKLLQTRLGHRIEIVGISARRKSRRRAVDIKPYRWFDSPITMLEETRPDIAVELIGGGQGPQDPQGIAYKFAKRAIRERIHLVSANKALLAEHGNELAEAAERAGVTIAFEAAIGGGIPIVKSIREAAVSSDIDMVTGILNGTCNFILSRISESGEDFAVALKEAQRLGYAEQDPSFDIQGTDAAHKIALLAALAFGCQVNTAGLEIAGIEKIDTKDIAYAKELGYCIKLLAQAEKFKGGIRQSVSMRMLPLNDALAHVEDSFNAVDYRDKYNERITLTGHGAGDGATASAVIADIADLARGVRYPMFGLPYKKLKPHAKKAPKAKAAAHYIRFQVKDVKGVLSRVSRSFFKHDISVESVIQHGRSLNMSVALVFVTHPCESDNLAKSLRDIGKFDFMLSAPCVIQISAP